MLGHLTISRDGVALALPASRKVRALFAHLALAARAVPRSQLCELLWDAPSDPRGELRWCLSKIRSIVDGRGRRRIHTRDDTIRLDLSDCFVDAIEIARATAEGIEKLGPERQRALSALFGGDFLEGLEVDRSPLFDGWLTAQRRRFRGCHAALLEHLVKSVPADRARAARRDPRRRGARGGDRATVRGRRSRLRADSRRMAVGQGASRGRPSGGSVFDHLGERWP